MKVSGIVSEYNIFHNGHKFILDEMRKSTDAVVAVMSGSFVQRGDVSIADKWSRAKAALLNGVDLVIELPAVYSLSTAQRFAYSSVFLLNATGIINELCFGSENGNISELSNAASILQCENPTVSSEIQRSMAQGMNYPSAREKAYSDIIDSTLLSSPNNILAIEYIQALNNISLNITPVTFKRIGTGYNDIHTKGNIASASAIRNMILNKIDYTPYIPSNFNEYILPYRLCELDNAMIYFLRNCKPQYLKSISEVIEGLENRIIRLSYECSSISELAENIKVKRYTRTKINRMLICAFLGITKNMTYSNPEYIRILGMTHTGMKLLHMMKETSSLPVITKVADCNYDDNPVFEAELRASEAFSLCAPSNSMRVGKSDFKTSPIII